MRTKELAVLLSLIGGTSANATPVRDIFKVDVGCYPVAYNAVKDEITTVCRGGANWVPEGVQFFSDFDDEHMYRNRLNIRRTLARDLAEGVGPGPWFDYYFAAMDKAKIPRP